MSYSYEDVQSCIKHCWDCRHACQTALYTHCLEVGGNHVKPQHVKMMTDCIQICQTAADFMTRQSDNHAQICAVCADICAACAKSCEAVGKDSMSECIQACLACADECRRMGSIQKAA